MSKRFVVSLIFLAATVGLSVYGIDQASVSPGAANSIAAIIGVTVPPLAAGIWKYIAGETVAPSYKGRKP